MKIYCQPHVLFAARHMVNQLAKLGIKARIVEHLDLYSDEIYLIYNAHTLFKMPKRYIVVQTEFCKSHWFHDQYIKKLQGALAVWDYAEVNLNAYRNKVKNCHLVTPGVWPQPEVKKDIEYLFYGHIEGSARRSDILEWLEQSLNIYKVTNLLGPPMWEILARTKTVVNIHYYDESPLETYRICEALSFGCKVWLYDEQDDITSFHDNLEEIKNALP